LPSIVFPSVPILCNPDTHVSFFGSNFNLLKVAVIKLWIESIAVFESGTLVDWDIPDAAVRNIRPRRKFIFFIYLRGLVWFP
jgi:hypothetical protein